MEAQCILPGSVGRSVGAPARGGLGRGTILGGALRLIRRLGVGGESEVHAARDLRTGERVAVKCYSDLDRDEAARRSACERAPLEAVQHPNLVRLHERGAEGAPYLALEALDSRSLASRLRHARLPSAAAVRVVCEVAGALSALHAGGWAHRDVKAENVLFGRDGRAVLTDLGLACDRALSAPALTRSKGTPAYMAPELIAERAHGFDALCAADQYALGVTAFFALTGALPFERENVMATFFAQLATPAPRLSSRAPSLARFDGVIARALAKDPAERFASVADFARALAACDCHG